MRGVAGGAPASVLISTASQAERLLLRGPGRSITRPVPGRAGKRFFAAGPASDAAHKQENSQLPVLLSLSTAGNCSWKDSLCENSAVGVSSVP